MQNHMLMRHASRLAVRGRVGRAGLRRGYSASPPRWSPRAAATREDCPEIRVAVVGAGPGGFYTTKYLLRDAPGCTVDLYDRLPTPYGLVRSGVAPDHQDVKAVQNDFAEVARDAEHRFNFYGNVTVGGENDAGDVSVEELRKRYNAVVMCYGASADRALGLPGEDLDGVHSARSVVNWYNSHPEYAEYGLDLTGVKTVVIIGQGNVAVDCARVLTASPEKHLASSDISDYALEALKSSEVERVVVVGRRGHVQAAFTVKELRELTKLDGVTFFVAPESLEAGVNAASEIELKERVAKRKNKLLVASAGRSPTDGENSKTIELQFLRGPIEILPREDDPSRVGGVRFAVNVLDGPAGGQYAVDSGEREDISCDLVLKSVGYKVEPLDGVAFDEASSTVSTGRGEGRGRVLDSESGVAVPGLYTAGWAKRGPTGVQGSNKGKVRDKLFVVDEMMEVADVFGMRATSPEL
eukprot:g1776.t1